MHTIALIVAAGQSTRLESPIPKPYQRLGNQPILAYSLQIFLSHPTIQRVVVILQHGHESLYEEVLRTIQDPEHKLLPPVIGGATRAESVRNGLTALTHQAPTHILIHDAARPYLDAALIERVQTALRAHPAVIPVIPVEDTLKHIENHHVIQTLPREHLFRAQTPQGFHFDTLRELFTREASLTFTDEAALCERHAIPVHTVAGARRNLKITYPEDLPMNTSNTPDIRTGFGYDVHRFTEENTPTTLMLCGIPIPHSAKLLGHSDADVGLHALTDALLATISDGDIGAHFPPSDPRWKGCDSSHFLTHAHSLIEAQHGRIHHIDLTFICEAPKITPHRDAMRARLSELLALPISRISVKATTTEGLGFTGRREGIAAHAIATVYINA